MNLYPSESILCPDDSYIASLMTILKLSFSSMRYLNLELRKGKGLLSERIANNVKLKVSREWEWVKNFRDVR